MKNIIIFGNGSFAKTLTYYIENYTNWSIEGYTTDLEFEESMFNGKKYINFRDMVRNFPPDNYEIILGIGYKKMNDLRKEKFEKIKKAGYSIPNFIHPSAIINNTYLGEGNVILENVIIEPFTVIGNNNILWSASMIGHNVIIGDNNQISAGTCVSGSAVIGDNCFLGTNCTIKNSTKIASYTLVGAGSYISKDTKEYAVYPTPTTKSLKGFSSLDII